MTDEFTLHDAAFTFDAEAALLSLAIDNDTPEFDYYTSGPAPFDEPFHTTDAPDQDNGVDENPGQARYSADFDDAPPAPSDLTDDETAQMANDMISLIEDVYDPNLLDPLLYIEDAVNAMINASSASDELKERLNAKTPILVSYREPYERPSGHLGTSVKPNPLLQQHFTLDEIVTDSYRRQLTQQIKVKVHWPYDYPADLIETLESADLQNRYQAAVKQRLSSSDAKMLLRLQLSVEAGIHLERYAKRPDIPAVYREAALAFARGEARLKHLQFLTQTRQYTVGDAFYLPCEDEQRDGGIIVFLGEPENNAVLTLPMKNRRLFIEWFRPLHKLILQRLPLYEQLRLGDYKLKPIYSLTSVHASLIMPLQFRDEGDVFNVLQNLKVERMIADMDTIVSTDEERVTDQLLATGIFLFQALAFLATIPLGAGGSVGVRLLAAFLLGQSAAALEAIRGASADTPQEAQDHYRSALFASVSAVVVPLALKLAGKALSAIARTKVSAKIMQHFDKTRPYPGTSPALADKIKPHPADLKRVKGETVHNLSKGPEHGQSLINRDARILTRHVEGHDLTIYRGKVFRGDTRPPEEIFSEGFKLRTPLEEIQKDIHQITGVRGGFGGDPNAIGLDGRGISTSAFYYKEHTGAFVYGGQKGGHTYLIDARKLDGYHLYQNHHNARYPTAVNNIKYNPTEINYGQDIAPHLILGAYDAAGVFIPNNPALKKYTRDIVIKIIRETLVGATAAAATATVIHSGITVAHAVATVEVETG